jgi:hypothetical protein
MSQYHRFTPTFTKGDRVRVRQLPDDDNLHVRLGDQGTVHAVYGFNALVDFDRAPAGLKPIGGRAHLPLDCLAHDEKT